MKSKKIWELVKDCAEELTREGEVTFTRQDIIKRIQNNHPDVKSGAIHPIIQGLTDNLSGGVTSACGEILHSTARGQFELITGTTHCKTEMASKVSSGDRSTTSDQEQVNRPSLPVSIEDNGVRFDVNIAFEQLSPIQRKKLRVAAEILKITASLYDGTKCLLPHWAAGVISHGQPKSRDFVVGITDEAQKSKKSELARDHLYRVTATAEYILLRASGLSIDEIEKILLVRSIQMITTRTQNNKELKRFLKKCSNKDDWRELYRVAGIGYHLY